ncbi:ZNF48 [Cervus elaphus hippelaphus]|uniref:ZNF48 n=1 Tax=Cervus elaphus hippelaphus TaxID=46360 RepID=A0A212CZS5_CEREH|nr:ZNF48 [Cervus elaphus hippelaphus]
MEAQPSPAPTPGPRPRRPARLCFLRLGAPPPPRLGLGWLELSATSGGRRGWPDTATIRKSLRPSASSSSPGSTRLIPPSSGNWTRLRVALSAARGCPPATELQRTRAAPTGVQLLQGPRAARCRPALPLPVPAPSGRPRDARVQSPSRHWWHGHRSPTEELRRAPDWRKRRLKRRRQRREGKGASARRKEQQGGVPAMERAPNEFEHAPQEDDLEFKEEEDLAPGHEVGNASLKPEGIQTWDDLWDTKMPGEQQTEEEEEEEMQEEMVLLVKGEEEEGEEKYEVVKLKIPMDNKEFPKDNA